MKNILTPVAVAATALLLGGCFPEEGIWWSPDGQTAAVRAPDGLRLAGPKGELSAPILSGEVQSAAWMPDGSVLVVSRSFKVTDWTAAQAMIPEGEAAASRRLARAMPDLLKAGLVASEGSVDDLEKKFFEPLGLTKLESLEAGWSCALTLHRREIEAVLAGFPNARELRDELLADTNGVTIHEITAIPMHNGRPSAEVRPLVRSLGPLVDPIVSPHYPVLAFRTGQGALKSITLDAKAEVLVADRGVRSAVWSADGRALLHVVMADSDKTGEIRLRTVVSAGGELLAAADPATASGPAMESKTLALAAFNAQGSGPRLRVLPDGRVLFASVPATLPARPQSMPLSARFFLLDPAREDAAPVPVAVTEGSLPDDLNAFAPSPDGRFVAVAEGGTDAVAVLELATGKAKIISPAHAGWKSRLIPAWRNNQELVFAALPSPAASRPELVLWQAGSSARVLSKNWPEEITKAWLEAPNTRGSQPAK